MAVAHVELYKAFGQHGNESFLCCLFFREVAEIVV